MRKSLCAASTQARRVSPTARLTGFPSTSVRVTSYTKRSECERTSASATSTKTTSSKRAGARYRTLASTTGRCHPRAAHVAYVTPRRRSHATRAASKYER
jgi:hypothetical protein